MQHTLQNAINIDGIGLHSGKPVRMRLVPARADHGIIFKRMDLEEGKNLIPALYSNVVDSRLCTVIANEHGAQIGTIEHLMAALRGCGVDNVLVELDSTEIPVMDGSAKAFVEAIDATGLKEQAAPRRAIRILKDVTVRDGDKYVRFSPSNVPVYTGRIQFSHAAIGDQAYSLKLVNGNFRHDVADCRTFGFFEEGEQLRKMGLGLGASLDNAVVLDQEGVMNADGLRCTDEFVRHKILDAVGDSYLGGIILGAYEGYKPSHALNNAILHAVFSDTSAWMPVDLYGDIDEITETVLWSPAGQSLRTH